MHYMFTAGPADIPSVIHADYICRSNTLLQLEQYRVFHWGKKRANAHAAFAPETIAYYETIGSNRDGATGKSFFAEVLNKPPAAI